MKSIETYIVDAFTNKPFQGNPAGVCIVEEALSDELMLSIAQELGLSETAFIQKKEDADIYSIRYFSPKMEIPLCGHATLGSSKVLFEKYPDKERIHFKNIQDLDLHITRKGNSIEMLFPVYESVPQSAPQALLDALGISTVINSAYNKETHILLLEIESSEVLQNLSPDFEKLKTSHNAINGVLVTACSQRKEYDFESRYFWPWSGTHEDPVTGGTHTFLTPYWSTRLHKKKMNSFQCSERSGFMTVELLTDTTLSITSEAQIVFKGFLQL